MHSVHVHSGLKDIRAQSHIPSHAARCSTRCFILNRAQRLGTVSSSGTSLLKQQTTFTPFLKAPAPPPNKMLSTSPSRPSRPHCWVPSNQNWRPQLQSGIKQNLMAVFAKHAQHTAFIRAAKTPNLKGSDGERQYSKAAVQLSSVG